MSITYGPVLKQEIEMKLKLLKYVLVNITQKSLSYAVVTHDLKLRGL